MIDLFSDEMRRDPYPFYQQLKQYGPLLSDAGKRSWMLTDYALIKQVLGDYKTFSSDVTLPQSKLLDWLVYTDPPVHTRLRSLFTRALKPQSFVRMEPVIRRIAIDLLNRNIERGDMDLVSAYSAPLPARVISELIGIPAAEQPQFLALNAVLQDLSAALMNHQMNPHQMKQYERLQGQLRTNLSAFIAQKRSLPCDDLLTRLVQSQVGDESLSESEIIGFIQMLYSGATETTSNLIGNAVLTFLEYPEQLALLQARPELISSAVEEVLRFRSPIQTLIRKTRCDTHLLGQEIPAGAYIFAFLGAANRDPQIFSNPDQFDICREPNPHISFGYGPHYCIGLQLARLEVRIAIQTLFASLKNLRLLAERPWTAQKVQYMLGPASLPVGFSPASKISQSGS